MKTKFSLSSDDMKKAFKKIGQAVNNNTVLPILKNVYCRVTSSEVELITSDLEITISYKIPAAAVEGAPFEILLPYDYLNKIMSACGTMPVTIDHPSARKAKFICGTDVFELNSLDKPDEYPKLPETPKKNTLACDQKFIGALVNALPTTSKDELRPSMTRVLVDMKEDHAFVVSTDAHSLFRYKLDIKCEKQQQIQFNKKMVKAIEGMENITVSWTKERVALQNDIITVWCQMFEDRYPAYEVVIPAYGPNLEVKKSAVVDAMHKALIPASDTYQININPKQEVGFINYTSENTDTYQKYLGKMAADYSGDVEAVSLNAK